MTETSCIVTNNNSKCLDTKLVIREYGCEVRKRRALIEMKDGGRGKRIKKISHSIWIKDLRNEKQRHKKKL